MTSTEGSIVSTGIENDHNVYVLGAGFSTMAGMPLVNNFLDRMRHAVDWLSPQAERRDEVVAIRRVLEFLHSAAAAGYRTTFNPENIEELFSLASALGDTETSRSMALAISSTLDFCGSTGVTQYARIRLPYSVARMLPFNSTSPATRDPSTIMDLEARSAMFHLAALLGLAGGEVKPGSRNTIVSFNYDLVVEGVAAEIGTGVNYLIPESDITYEGRVQPPGDESIPLIKLHGSINWADDPTGRLRVFDSYHALRKAGGVPSLIPPTWRKDFTRHFEKVWHGALDAFRKATRVCIIGFSLPETDVHFKYLLAAGLRDNISLRKILFIDPNIGELRPRIEKLLRPELHTRGMLEFCGLTLADAISEPSFLASIGRPRYSGPPPAFFERPADW